MTRNIAFIGALVGAAFVAAACGGGSSLYGSPSSSQGGPGAATPPGSPAPSAFTVGLRSTALGQILVDSNGRTLYLFAADKGTTSSCYGSCASVWPPLTA